MNLDVNTKFDQHSLIMLGVVLAVVATIVIFLAKISKS